MASQSIGGISVTVSANTAKFRTGIEKARAHLTRFTSSIRKAMFSVKGFGVLLAGGMMGNFVRGQMMAVDALAKTSSKLGIATEELQGLRHAAELSGVASNALDMAIQKMGVRLSEAARGGGEATKVLREMGLDAVALSKLSPEKQMEAIADGMLKISNQSDRARIASKLFEEEGVALVNMLKGGSAGLREMSQELKVLGVAITAEAAAKVEKANDAWTRFSTLTASIGANMVTDMAPGFEWLFNKMSDLIVKGRELSNTLERLGNKNMGTRFGDYARLFIDGTPLPGSLAAATGSGLSTGGLRRAASSAVGNATGTTATNARDLLGAFGRSTGLNDLSGMQQRMRKGLLGFAATGGVDSANVSPIEKKRGERGTGVRNLLDSLANTMQVRASRFAMEKGFQARMLGKGAGLLGQAGMFNLAQQQKGLLAGGLNNASIGAVDANSAAGFAQRTRAMRNDPQMRIQKDQLKELRTIAKNTKGEAAVAAAFD